MDNDLEKRYFSHLGKSLQEHLRGVRRKVLKRIENLPTNLNFKTAEIAAVFHDLGKINPNFQEKLKPIEERKNKELGYSSHAYLSAFVWFCFFGKNHEKLVEWFSENAVLNLHTVAALLARHHGNLPDFENGIFNQTEANRLCEFLSAHSDLPISDFLRLLEHFEEHESFSLQCEPITQNKILNCRVLEEQIEKNPLGFFLETQFGFACLLESDKRDAGANEIFKRENLKSYFEENFAERIAEKLNGFSTKSDLNQVRTAMREEAIENLRLQLESGKRVFTLSAPTGAGKTMMLLALAKEILKDKSDLSVVYALPFLSITEQVEGICKEIFYDIKEFDNGRFEDEVAVMRIDSRSENERIQQLQEEMETDQNKEKLTKILRENFSEETFDHRFIVTTFVQVFETLVSNRNATLLRLPNFSRSIFLLDEIQALPPRLYTFFVAFLDEFCRQFDSYAIVSTATMPYLEIAGKKLPNNEKPKKLFANYETPSELLSAKNYFNEKVFNRYQISKASDINSIEKLAGRIIENDESCLVILNTIDDTKLLYERLADFYNSDECVLLNTHFTLNDRRKKLSYCQERLRGKKKIILVSTQLIEAGVDIDFPVLYRDLCPLPNLIQSAGRCNRNGEQEIGKVYFIALQKENGKISAELIYRGKDKILLDFGRYGFPQTITESEMKMLQEKYFEFVGRNLSVGVHEQTNIKLNMIRHINKAEFETLGKFRLIDEKEFGEEFRYYVKDDGKFEELKNLAEAKTGESFAEARSKRIAIETKLREMSGDIVQFRVSKQSPPGFSDEILGICKLSNESDYSSERGIRLEIGSCFI